MGPPGRTSQSTPQVHNHKKKDECYKRSWSHKSYIATSQGKHRISKMPYCNLIINSSRVTKLANNIMVINPVLVVIELKGIPNDNPTNDFYWMQKCSSINFVQCHTTSRRIIFYHPNPKLITGKF